LNKNNKTRKEFLSLLQFSIILAPFALFFDAALMFRGKLNLSVPAAIVILIILNGGCLLLAALSVLRYITYRKQVIQTQPADRMTRKERLLSYLPVTLAAGVFAVLAGLQFDTVFRYDGGLYYDSLLTATETFTFTLDSYLQSFALWTHPMQGTSLLIGAGEMFLPRQCIGVYIVTLLVTLAAVFCLYGIMGRIFPGKAPWLKAAGTAVFAFCPYVLGLFSHLSADYFSLMFLVILIYTFAVELDYLAAFVTILLVFSKETGILFAASFLIPAVLIRAAGLEGKHYFAKLMKYLFPGRIMLYGAAPVLFICYSLFSKGLTFGSASTDKSPFRWDSTGIHCFGIDFGYISVKLSQILYYNFFWIITLLLLVSVFMLFYRKSKNEETNLIDPAADMALIAGIIMSSFVYMVFSCLFITIPCPRYNVLFALPVSLISVGAVSYIWKNRTAVKIVMSTVILLFALQTYVNLDPSLSIGNEKLDLGHTYIYSPTGEYSYMNLYYMGEMYVYNRTFDYAEDLLDQAMEKINPDVDDRFIMVGVDWYEIYLIGDPLQTEHLIYWDSVNQRRTYDYEGDGVFLPNMSSIFREEFLSGKEIDLPDDFYFILTAREDDAAYVGALEARGYAAEDSFVVENYIGYMTVYHMVHSR